MSKDKTAEAPIEEKETVKKSLFKYTGPETVWYEGRKVKPSTWTEAEAKDALAKYPTMFKNVFVF